MTPLSAGIDVDSLVAGFAFAAIVTCVLWAALVGLTILRRMLSDSSEL